MVCRSVKDERKHSVTRRDQSGMGPLGVSRQQVRESGHFRMNEMTAVD